MAKSKSAFRGKEYRVEVKTYNIGPRSLDEWEYRVRLVHQTCNRVVAIICSDPRNDKQIHMTRKAVNHRIQVIRESVKHGNRIVFEPQNCQKCGGHHETSS